MIPNTGKLKGKTIFITGASRGIGKAIALKAAKDGANIVIAAKTAEAHPKLPGTIYTAADEIEKAGGRALPCIVDVRDEASIAKAVEAAVKRFGGIDIVVNNASAIHLTGTLETPMKRYDLMHNINTRGTYLVSKLCLPHLLKSSNAHILNISPPLNMHPRWFKVHVAYTMAKYGMSMCVLGMAEEFRDAGVACNALWPRTAIITAATEFLGGETATRHSRKAEIMADAAYIMLCKDSRIYTGNFAIDEGVLREEGVADFTNYSVNPNLPLAPDFFIEDVDELQAEMDAHYNMKGKRMNAKL
ncbi:Hydroxysteroid dehydrogenase-like protein 2 [Halocaridina rubra]|uniref:Hydroxysteroid dehydrogenase-like protein 2 n=1 Tax=Halocaridina rubra TaxID=373956 RepID=A0AAN8WVM3_HALRR